MSHKIGCDSAGCCICHPPCGSQVWDLHGSRGHKMVVDLDSGFSLSTSPDITGVLPCSLVILLPPASRVSMPG